jgi:hypothetical protein
MARLRKKKLLRERTIATWWAAGLVVLALITAARVAHCDGEVTRASGIAKSCHSFIKKFAGLGS